MLLLLFPLLTALARALADPKMASEVAGFARSNGFSPVTLVEIPSGPSVNFDLEVLKALRNENIQVSHLTLEKMRPNEGEVLNQDFIFATVKDQEEWLAVMDICSCIRIRSVLVVTTLSSFEFSKFPSSEKNVHFFVLSLSNLEWFEVIAIANTNGQLIVNPLRLFQLVSAPLLTLPHYDFKNITILDEDLSWMPLMELENCDDDGQNCVASGILGKTSGNLEALLNLRISFSRNSAGNWGIQSEKLLLEGQTPNSSSVLASVALGKTHISISGWHMTEERSRYLDMAWQITDQTVLVIGNTLPPSMDLFLYIRPFHQNVWIATMGLALSVSVLMFIMEMFNITDTQSYRILINSFLFFFVILHAFYTGALTMFFANEPNLPFQSLEGAMRAHPEWELLISAESNFYQEPNELSSRVYRDFWRRAIEEREDALQVQNNLEGLQRVARERASLQLFRSMFNHFTQKPELRQHTFNIVAKPLSSAHLAAALPLNSPLSPAVSHGYMAMRESGIMRRLQKKFYKEQAKKTRGGIVVAMSLNDTILAFLIVGLTSVICLILLGAECLMKRC